jgi:hypothetical protein
VEIAMAPLPDGRFRSMQELGDVLRCFSVRTTRRPSPPVVPPAGWRRRLVWATAGAALLLATASWLAWRGQPAPAPAAPWLESIVEHKAISVETMQVPVVARARR